MARIKIDKNAHDILGKYKELLTSRGIDGADFSDAIREMAKMAELHEHDTGGFTGGFRSERR